MRGTAKTGIHKPEVSRTRARASLRALKREPHAAASPGAIARQARSAARKRSPAQRHAAAMKAVRTKRAVKRRTTR